MESTMRLFFVVVLSGLAYATEVNVVNTPLEPLARSDYASDKAASVPDESHSEAKPQEREIGGTSIFDTPIINGIPAASTTFQPLGGISPIYQPQNPAYQSQLGMSVSSYQPQNPGLLEVLSHPKETEIEKKVVSSLKDTKPSYYPKESSYSTIPEQPQDSPLGARFVADPSRSHLIEEMTPAQIKQLTHQQAHPYSLIQQPVPMPGYNFNYIAAVPGAAGSPYHNPYHQMQPETATVKYAQTEHGFMERVWGEVVTMRETITQDFFGAIPTFFRNVWDAIVGAVSSASARMSSLDLTTASARMLESVDWFHAFQFIVRQLD